MDTYKILGASLLLVGFDRIHAGLDIVVHPESQAVVEGDDVILNCLATYTPDLVELIPSVHPVLVYHWEYNTHPVGEALVQASEFTNHSLFIPKINTWGYGSYQCIIHALFDDGNITTPSDVATVVQTYLDPFYLQPLSQSMSVQQTINLQCVTGTGAPLPTVHWEKDGIFFSGGMQTVGTFGDMGAGHSGRWTMQLELNLTADSGGNYTCVTENKLTGQVITSEPANIEVKVSGEMPYFISDPPTEVTLMVNRPVLMSCDIGGTPPLAYRWYRNSRVVRKSPRFTVLPNGTFYIPLVIKDDALPYRCSAKNNYGSLLSPPIKSIVTYLDISFLLHPVNTTGIAGQSASLYCTPPASVPTAKVIWYKDNTPLKQSSGQFAISVLSNWSLVFANVQLSDAGIYRCEAINELASPTTRMSSTAYLIVTAAPTFIEPPINQKLLKGDVLQLTCKVTGSPLPVITWYYGNTQINTTNSPNIDTRLSGSELYILSINIADEGWYSCTAYNVHGLISSTKVYVDVIVAPEIIHSLTNITVTEGGGAYLTCQVYGDPEPRRTWYHDNTKLDTDSSQYTVDDGGLHILRVSAQQGGVYRCVAVNEGGTRETSGYLTVQVLPRIMTPPYNQTVNESSRVVFYCDIIGVPMPTVTWTFNDSLPLPAGSEITADNKSVILPRAGVHYRGRYTCTGVNKVGRVHQTAYLVIQVQPAITALLANSELITEGYVLDQGHDLELDCKVTGIPSPHVHWYFRDLKLFPTPEGRVTFPSPSKVMVKFVSAADEGLYECRVDNSVGQKSRTTHVYVREVPLSPYLSDVIPMSKTSVRLSWIPATVPYGQEVTGYIVEYKKSSTLVYQQYPGTFTTNITNAEIGGLSPATEYVFRVAAVNHLGRGGYSNTLGAKTLETAPSSPRQLSLVSLGPTWMTLQWEEPEHKNGDIKMYEGWYKYRYSQSTDYSKFSISSSSSDSSHISGPLQLYNLTQLLPYTSYSIKVRAATVQDDVIMWGDFTSVLDATTAPQAPSKPPTQVQLVALSSRSIQVLWKGIIPGNQNGPLKGYIIRYKQTTMNTTSDIKESPEMTRVVIEQLLPWRYYEVTVMSYNNVGEGPVSDKKTVRTLAEVPSGPPQQVTLSSRSATVVEVSWKPVAESERNCDISGYIVAIESDIDEDTISKYVGSADILKVNLSQLRPWTKYYIRIQAFTTQLHNGFGPFSDTRAVTTLQDVPGTVDGLTLQSSPFVIDVTWSPPSEPNGELTGYTLISAQLHDTIPQSEKNSLLPVITSHFVGPTILSYRIQPVTTGTSHIVGVAAHTIRGQGPFTNTTIFTVSLTSEVRDISTTGIAVTTTARIQTDITMDTSTPVDRPTGAATSGLSDEQVAGIVIGVLLVVVAVIVVVIVTVYCCRKRRKKQSNGFSGPYDINSRIGSYPGFEATSNKPSSDTENLPHTYHHRDGHTHDHNYPYRSRSSENLEPTEITQSKTSSQNNIGVSAVRSRSERSHIESVSDRELSIPSTITGPMAYQNSVAATNGTQLDGSHLGVVNPGFMEDDYHSVSMETNRHSRDSTQLDDSLYRRHHMDSTIAAAIAAERDRNTSVFDIPDDESLVDVDTSVIVFDERTAL